MNLTQIKSINTSNIGYLTKTLKLYEQRIINCGYFGYSESEAEYRNNLNQLISKILSVGLESVDDESFVRFIYALDRANYLNDEYILSIPDSYTDTMIRVFGCSDFDDPHNKHTKEIDLIIGQIEVDVDDLIKCKDSFDEYFVMKRLYQLRDKLINLITQDVNYKNIENIERVENKLDSISF